MKCFACCTLCYSLLGFALLTPVGVVAEDRYHWSLQGYGVEALAEVMEDVEDAVADVAEAAVSGESDGIWGLGGFCIPGLHQDRDEEGNDKKDGGAVPTFSAYPVSGCRTVCDR